MKMMVLRLKRSIKIVKKYSHNVMNDYENKKENEKENSRLHNYQKWKYTLYTVLLVLILMNPYTYKFVHKLLGKLLRISDQSGCPTSIGFFLHVMIFTVILRYLMELNI